MILDRKKDTFCLWFLVDIGNFLNKSLIKLYSLCLKILCRLFFIILPNLNFLRNRFDFGVKDHLIIFDKEQSLRYLNIVFKDIFDSNMNGIHFINTLYYLLLLISILLIYILKYLLMMSKWFKEW